MDFENGQLIIQDQEIITFDSKDDFAPGLVVTQETRSGSQLNPAMNYLLSLGSKQSRAQMSSILNNVANMIGQVDINHCQWSLMRRHHIQAIVSMLQDSGKAPSTINTYLSALKGVANEAWSSGGMTAHDYQHIKAVKSVRGSRITKGRMLSQREIRVLFSTIDTDTGAKGLRDAAMVSTLIGCGLRRSEIVSLDIDDLNEREGYFRVIGKGNKEREAYLNDASLDRIKVWIDEIRGDEPGALFTRIRARDDVTMERLSPQAILHILDTRREESGIEHFSPHDLRRTFASTLLDQGVDIKTVRDMMGHASITTTSKYDRRNNDRLKKAAQSLSF